LSASADGRADVDTAREMDQFAGLRLAVATRFIYVFADEINMM
jgi:hypothetical protein